MDRLIIDVREPHEHNRGHVKGSINLPLSVIDKQIDFRDIPSKDTELIIYCQSGNRSSIACNILSAKGYTKVINGINQAHIEKNYF